MLRSADRILTTHVGSLPRSQAVTDVLFAREGHGQMPANPEAVIADAVKAIVQKQVDVGIDVVSDGEMGKISYATYIKDRLSGFDGDTPREPGQDLVEHPRLLQKLAKLGSTASYRRPRCVAEIRVTNLAPMHEDIANMKAALASAKPRGEGFINTASPGTIALFQPNDFYPTQDAYLEAVAEGMRAEYEGLVAAGLLIQIDAPDMAMGRHTMYRDRTEDDFIGLAARHIEVLNHALRNVPADRVRMHVCWGNYEGPHTHDVPLEKLLPVVMKAKPQAILFEGANPRHAHEWQVFRDLAAQVPEDKLLVPGVLSTTTNYVEHPRLVAERLEHYADVVGRERVLAGTDCGFGTFAGFGPVDPDIVWMKLKSLVDGAQMASEKLWGRR
ncbi:MAG: cobalamin-independent methionine synthase II family protein [Nevskiaceae bacterium]|jgi:5-methyltetrahydropteroyltriglutamate--homocysteine methyltransferase|nr:cobalamin-independent methionine synthase II family protein [Nevskiaceae bacterium]